MPGLDGIADMLRAVVLIQPVLDYPGKAASMTATAAREVLRTPLLHGPLLQGTSGRGHGVRGLPVNPLECFYLLGL